jgi:hypothetical protein
MRKNFSKIIFMLATSFLTSCASVTTGTNQSISVNTEPEKGATCELHNDKGTWYVSSTPGSVVVHRAYSDLNIVCRKGEKTGNTVVKSTTKGMAFGNILVGGIIGTGVDMSTGAAYDYPTSISVLLK